MVAASGQRRGLAPHTHRSAERAAPPAGRLVIDDFVIDDRVPGEEGGLIDALTREVDVTWWTDRERIDAFWAAHRDRTGRPER